MLKNNDNHSLEIVTWEQIRTDVKAVNPELANIIDAIDPGKRYPLIRARYKFGDLIIKEGKLQFPASPHLNQTDKQNLRNQLAYSPIPLTLLLNKVSEIFVMDEQRVIPLKVFTPGKLFGTFETLNYAFDKFIEPAWNIVAGVRSIFTLPKITASLGLKRLRYAFDLSSDTTTHSFGGHWYLFKQLANHEKFTEEWEATVIFFTQAWFSFKQQDKEWFDFQRYVFREGWLQIQQVLNREPLARGWQLFVKIIGRRRIRLNPYTTDTLKHLLLISIGELPAFKVAVSNIMAPIQGLQEALINRYLLDKYIPTIMCCESVEPSGHHNLYYSLSLPTLFGGTPESKNNFSTVMYELKMLKILIDTLQYDPTVKQYFSINNNFEYFHIEKDKHNEILSAKMIPQTDDLLLLEQSKFPDRLLCTSSSFWRGCIRIKV